MRYEESRIVQMDLYGLWALADAVTLLAARWAIFLRDRRHR
jgi:hypothetical protein